jgi:hypothetical protein
MERVHNDEDCIGCETEFIGTLVIYCSRCSYMFDYVQLMDGSIVPTSYILHRPHMTIKKRNGGS